MVCPPPILPKKKLRSWRILLSAAVAASLAMLTGASPSRLSPVPPSTSLFPCRLIVSSGYSGAACCLNGGGCAGTVTIIWSYACAGDCPSPQVCGQTNHGSQAIKEERTCAGSCPGNCTTTNSTITYGDTSTACDCVGPQ